MTLSGEIYESNSELIAGNQIEFNTDEFYDALWITILAMLFTIISIILSIFQFCFLKKHRSTSDCVMIVQFEFESFEIMQMKSDKFLDKIVFKRVSAIESTIAKLLVIATPNVERLMPVQFNKGCKFTFFIQINSIQFDELKIKFETSLNNSNDLAYSIAYALKLKEKVRIRKFDKILTLTQEANHVRYISKTVKRNVASFISKASGRNIFDTALSNSGKSGVPPPGSGASSSKGYVPPSIIHLPVRESSMDVIGKKESVGLYLETPKQNVHENDESKSMSMAAANGKRVSGKLDQYDL